MPRSIMTPFHIRLRTITACFLMLSLIALSGCGDEKATTDSGSEPGGSTKNPNYAGIDVSIPMVEYRLENTAGDKSVSAEMGGPGFTGIGWETRLEFLAMGSDKAVKGGSMSRAILDWPATLRQQGQNWNASINYLVADLCYPALVQQHPVTLDFIPGVASHWQVSEDKMTYRFRINPAAKWSNGAPITSADYVATYNLLMDPTILFPSNQVTYSKFVPKAISKYIVEIQCKDENWRNFLYAGTSGFFPAAEIGGLTGTEYLDQYQFSYTSFCGPYKVNPDDIVMNQSVTLTRNPDWWDADNPAWVGLFNIDKIRFEIVKEDALIYEKTKAGELDYYTISTAKWFANDLPKEDACKKGHLVRMKVFNDAPIGTSGIAMNSTREPFNDLRIRKAVAHLFDRDTMIDKLFYDEYAKLNSYWQGATYGNLNNKTVEYDEVAAQELLIEAGYKERNSEGYLVKDGKLLEYDLMYRGKGSEKFLTIIQESNKRLGVKVNLKLLTPSTWWKNLQGKEYDAAMANWGALVTPNPESSYKGELATKPDNNNVTGFSDPRVDELLVAYDEEYDVQKRRKIIKEIDGIIFAAQPYALGWYKPAQRVIFANKFSFPKWGTSRTWRDDRQMVYTWWVDPQKEEALEKARTDSSVVLPVPPLENHFWPAWNAAQVASGTQ